MKLSTISTAITTLVLESMSAAHQQTLPTPSAVRQLYRAASKEPPLNDPVSTAELFAGIYESALKHEEVAVTAIYEQGALTAFVYGHPWLWGDQQYPWAAQLQEMLDEAADRLEGTVALCLLARHPAFNGHGLGRRALNSWLRENGHVPVWLATSNAPSPAIALYDTTGFQRLGHGPDAPNGAPALVMLREAHSNDIAQNK